MSVVKRSALVPFRAEQMFHLVDDIEAYPEFLPWCKSAVILHRDDHEVRASLELARGALSKSFTTVNRNQPGKMIEMRLLEGPFRHLEGFWQFQSLGDDGCKVTLDMEYEFSSRILKMTVGPVFDHIANSLVDAFCQRARDKYAKQ